MTKLKKNLATLAALTLLASGSAFAQVTSSAGTNVTLTATLLESITVTLDQPTVTFALTPGSATNAGNVPVNVLTGWVLGLSRTNVKLYAYFDTSTAALAQGSIDIPSSAVSATVGGTAAGAFSNVVPFGTGITVFTQALTVLNRVSANTSAVALNIDLSSLPALPAGAYVGTLHFQAQAVT